ncbi:MAG: hypothetical protein NT166_30065 [Candidatus Aminicenantes bacterium]|nr:hypothetical protein [Candidatus Aminicenantes bacterium]
MSPRKQLKNKSKLGGKRRKKEDSAWKEIIEKFFEELMQLLFPGIHDAIDFSKPREFLNTEMRPIAPFNDMGDRTADVLVKVQLKSGTYSYICIFIHIEVQSEPQEHFMERMYIYNYRYYDKRLEIGTPVISLAILTDDDENYRPNEYRVSFCDFDLRMKIPIVKIMDFKWEKRHRERLEKATGPMALVIKAQLKSIELKKAGEDIRYEAVKELIRECYRAGYSSNDIYPLVKFIEWVIRISKENEKRLKEEIVKIEEVYNMPYLASWERSARRKGKIEGKVEGLEEGMVKKAKETARNLLEMHFDIDKIAKVTGLKKEEVKKLASAFN